MTPTQRTLALLKDRGMRCGMVERWNPHVRIRQDLFGFIDIIALDTHTIIGVQSCGNSHAAHYRKIVEEHHEAARDWLQTGARLILISWRKVKTKRGSKVVKWAPREVEILLDNLKGTSSCTSR